MTASPKELLGRHGLSAKKHFGQNFLTDPNLSAKIAEVCTTPSGGSVVELGAGLGALTGPLLARAAWVAAVERDRDLVPLLREHFEDAVAAGRLEILEADAKAIDPVALLAERPRPRVLAGNLPYQLSGPLLQLAVKSARSLDLVVYLVQLEVCDRVAAAPGTESYGALSVFVQAQFVPERALVVRRGAFYPQPGVDSALLVLRPRPEPISEETDAFRRVVSAAFAQRRKKLKNAWHALFSEPDALVRAAGRAGIDLDLRGERLDVAAFARMAGELER